jgi:S-formylglutathione hydrolase FrmB
MTRLAAAAGLVFAFALVPAAHAVTFHDGHGLHVLSVKQVDPRLVALQVKTAALPDPANVYILLPPGYDSARRYPVLYLLHGTSGSASDWTAKGDAEQVIGSRQLITVMPDIALNDGGGGWCSDWPNGAQRWETFHIQQLIPWVDANLRTIPTRAGRAIAGLSQGGFCSLSYAARHPDLFADALGYSGAPDIYFDPDARAGAQVVINGTEVGLDHVPPNTFFGDPVTNGVNWAAHDPATLAENLRSTHIYMYWGNGQPGPFDNPTDIVGGASAIERLIWQDNNDFQARLGALGIPALFDDYGPGTHAWPYWTRDLKWSIDKVMSDFAHPEAKPAPFTYTSAGDRYSVYGWRVTMQRTAREFSTLRAARSFSLAGSGAGIVTTPPRYRPGRRYTVALSGDRVTARSVIVRAGRSGRLRIRVPLGPSNPYQQYTAQAQVTGTAVYTTNVTIARSRRR